MATRERPLSPHLQVYRWQVQMVTDPAPRDRHRPRRRPRRPGGGCWRWPGCNAGAFAACAGSPFGKIVLLGFSWALAFHLINGIRHPVQDAGRATRS